MSEDKRICSNCKRPINSATFELHESHCLRHIKLCEVCDEPIPIKDMEEHFQENHAPTPCDLCGMRVAADHLEEHKESSCSEAKLECKYCELDIRRGDYLEHVDQCGSRTDYCELCNQRVMLKEMSEHKEMKCGHVRSESPLRQSDLRQMGLVDDIGNGSETDDENYYDNLPATPPHSYHSSHDNSMHVDPYWLQTVAEACGEDNLDTLLAQNVFFENMRSVRAGDQVINEEVRSHDSDMTAGEHSADRNEPSLTHQLPTDFDQQAYDTDKSGNQKVRDEDEDFYFAQRLQEREVMGHSRTLYDEERAREFAETIEEEEEKSMNEDYSLTTVQEPEPLSQDELLDEERTRISRREKMLEQLEETRNREEELREKEIKLAEQLKKTKEEKESLELVIALQKTDLAEGHRAIWKKSRLPVSFDGSEDRSKYEHTKFEDQPRPKTTPFPSESSVEIPCQWCNKLIPFEQVMLHQQSCQDDYYGRAASPSRGGCGLHLSEDTFRRVEEESPWEIDDFNIECSYCHVSVSVGRLATHEAVCESNPDIHLNKVYKNRVTPSTIAKPKLDLSPQPPPSLAVGATAKLLSVEKGPCEYCHEVIPLSQLINHEAKCVISRHKPSPAPPPSSPTLLKKSHVTRNDGVANKRGLAIKFPDTDLASASVNLDPYEGFSLEMNGHKTNPSGSSTSRKKRQSPFEHFEPVEEPEKKVSRSTSNIPTARPDETQLVRGGASLVQRHSPMETDGSSNAVAVGDSTGRLDGRQGERSLSARTKAAHSHTGQRLKSHSLTTSNSRPVTSSGAKYYGNSKIGSKKERVGSGGKESTSSETSSRPKRSHHTTGDNS